MMGNKELIKEQDQRIKDVKVVSLERNPFFEEKFDGLAYADQKAFVDLLDFEDPQLFNWLMNKQVPEDQALLRIIRLIQKRNQEYVASTL